MRSSLPLCHKFSICKCEPYLISRKREILSNMYSILNDMKFWDFCWLIFEQEHMKQYEQNVQDHQQYHDASQALVDWLTLMKDRFSLCSDTSGDSHTLQSKLDRVQVTAFYTPTIKVYWNHPVRPSVCRCNFVPHMEYITCTTAWNNLKICTYVVHLQFF